MLRLFIHGFSPVLPIPLILILLVISVAAAWWSYRKVTSSGENEYRLPILLTLRIVTFLMLSLLLLNPFRLITESDRALPGIALYFDNSQSMTIERGNYMGSNEYKEIIEDFLSIEDDRFSFSIHSFDNSVLDTLPNFKGTGTHLHRVMEHIRENTFGLVAAILISDGIPTVGRNPHFAAQQISVPILTFAVGDTSEVRDIAVTDVNYTPHSYLNTRQTLSVEIFHEGLAERNATLNLIMDGEIIETRVLDFTTDRGSLLHNFTVEFDETGFFDFRIEVPPLDDELTDRNNTFDFTIEVIDDKTLIHSLAFEVHPDISAVRRVMASDIQNELIVTNFLSENRFTGTDHFTLEEPADLLVLHGVPPAGSGITEWIEALNMPVIHFSLPFSQRNPNSTLFDALFGITISPSGSVTAVEIDQSSSLESHPLLDNLTIPVRMPRLNTVWADYRLSPLSRPLIGLNSDGVGIEQPMLIVDESGAHRMATVTTYGWHRFSQSSDPMVSDFFSQLVTNLVSWSATASDSRNLTLHPLRESYSESDPVTMRASLFNERGEPEREALIRLEIYYGDEEESLQEFTMSHLQDEIYESGIGIFPVGIYRAVAEATVGDRVIGVAESRFYITWSNIEFLNTRRNDQLLSQIAEVTGGIFVEDGDIDPIIQFLETIETDQITEMETRRDYLHSHFYWFLIVLLLLTAEWILRKQLSLQ